MIKYKKTFCLSFIIFCLIVAVLSILKYDVKDANAKDKTKVKNSSPKGIIYLTFDDGPSKNITGEVLDILKENEIKGTFFLIGNKIEGREDVVKRIYKEGHSIGMHTFTHDFNKIYKSKESFMEEMLLCNEEIYSVLGVKANIIRFPGGSLNHLDEEFLDRIHSKGFKVFDWNMQLSDGIDHNIPPEKLYLEGTKGSDKFYSITLLMHCDSTNKNTCKALPKIIKYYKDKNYEFKTITKDTPEYHFRVRKK
ncbi:polysaccharide deacetylase family protein [Haloimpatiens sp. FM7315]|uniref:polysaccharide deacetylase family protein n=1 Tax=Haloimpatiens sp. FM7315 TaxID=3298609 RepID=UPI00370BEADC